MKRLLMLMALGLLAGGCAEDREQRTTLPPDTGQTGIGGPGTSGTTGSGAGTSGVGVDRQRTTGTSTVTNRFPLTVE